MIAAAQSIAWMFAVACIPFVICGAILIVWAVCARRSKPTADWSNDNPGADAIDTVESAFRRLD